MARRELLEARTDRGVRRTSAPAPAPVPAGDGPACGRPATTRGPCAAVPRRSGAPSDPNVPHRRGGRDEDAEDALIDAQLADVPTSAPPH